MTTLTESINDYLVMRRGLGFKLVQTARSPHNFAVFMEAQGASTVTFHRFFWHQRAALMPPVLLPTADSTTPRRTIPD